MDRVRRADRRPRGALSPRPEVIPGAEAWSAAGGDVGALLLHGFTGNPVSLRPLAEALAAEGLAVELPRLPGHGTRWQDLQRTRARDWQREARAGLETLRARTRSRIVVGLSMGGTLALHLAAARPDALDGVVLVNPWVRTTWRNDPRLPLLPLLKHLRPGVPGVGNDIALPGADERAYPVRPLKALHSAIAAQRRLDLPAVRAPLLVFTSTRDHVVPTGDSAYVLDRAGSSEREQVWLRHSFHVATLDHDAPVIVERTVAFARRTAGA